MSLRIGFDLDGVLADMDGELGRCAQTLFGASAVPTLSEDDAETAADESVPYSRLSLSPRQQQRVWRYLRGLENFWTTLSEIEPGTVSRIAALSQERRWEVLFLTSRPGCAGLTTQIQTQRWLQAKGFPIPSVFVVTGSRGQIAKALDLDVVVDDRLENCLDVIADSKARSVLVWRQANEELPVAAKAGIAVVDSAAASLDFLVQLDAGADSKGGPMGKFKRLFGLKAPALD